MLLTNQRLDKLAAARADFDDHGMLQGTCLSTVWEGILHKHTLFTPITFEPIFVYLEMNEDTSCNGGDIIVRATL